MSIHVVTASHSLDKVSYPEKMDAKLEAVARRPADARGVAVAARQRDISWDCDNPRQNTQITRDGCERLPAVQPGTNP